MRVELDGSSVSKETASEYDGKDSVPDRCRDIRGGLISPWLDKENKLRD
jgi:hypothetical protein